MLCSVQSLPGGPFFGHHILRGTRRLPNQIVCWENQQEVEWYRKSDKGAVKLKEGNTEGDWVAVFRYLKGCTGIGTQDIGTRHIEGKEGSPYLLRPMCIRCCAWLKYSSAKEGGNNKLRCPSVWEDSALTFQTETGFMCRDTAEGDFGITWAVWIEDEWLLRSIHHYNCVDNLGHLFILQDHWE